MAVASAPCHTSFQRNDTSGTYLRIRAISTKMPAKETSALVAANNAVGSDRWALKNLPNAVSAVLNTSETSSRKPKPNTSANETSRDLMSDQRPADHRRASL